MQTLSVVVFIVTFLSIILLLVMLELFFLHPTIKRKKTKTEILFIIKIIKMEVRQLGCYPMIMVLNQKEFHLDMD
jgi:hypothetical protein